MLRLYLPGVHAGATRIRIAGAEFRHLRTLRLAPGARLCVLGEDGLEHDVVLERIGAREANGVVVASTRPSRESSLELVLAPALLKGTRMDLVVEKATELGVQRVAPVATRHAVSRTGHLERWRRIAVAAAKQSGRTRVPDIDEPVPLATLVAAPWPGLRLVPWEGDVDDRLDALPARAAAAVAVVGPEGGLAEDEMALARAHGFVPVTLGPRRLRAETAAIVIATLCQSRWGDG
jgi:16S rRNA (uracil1498-N3)-methyltransferase